MKTFFIQTLGCKVNHYESEQIATLLRSRGLEPAPAGLADLRIVHSCSVTTQAASQSRQSVRRLTRLPVLQAAPSGETLSDVAQLLASDRRPRSRVIVTGCWATSNSAEAAAMPGVDAVLGHHQDLGMELDQLLANWQAEQSADACVSGSTAGHNGEEEKSGNRAGQSTMLIEPKPAQSVNGNPTGVCGPNEMVGQAFLPARSDALTGQTRISAPPKVVGATSLPLLGQRQSTRQRAFLKIQDGCDAHCTYCIIPTLRPTLWSKPVESVVEEARNRVSAGHVEIVLTGIFLGAYGQPTALRRRQPQSTAKPLGKLINAICVNTPGLRRLRLSSLEPGDLTDELIDVLRHHRQVVPHFHLPLQSGSDALLRRMNRQYTRGGFLQMVERVNAAFDQPALTTDVIVGFPGETDDEFERTVEVVRAAGFIHVHAFPYSPRPGTAAARWTEQYVRGPIVNERIARLRDIAAEQSFAFRSGFVGETVEVIIERHAEDGSPSSARVMADAERDILPCHWMSRIFQPGDAIRAKITNVTREETFATAVF